MRKVVAVAALLVLGLLAFGALAGCSRSASASTPTATQDPRLVASIAALHTEEAGLYATQTQVARPSATATPTQVVTATATPVLFGDIVSAEKQVDARWAVDKDVMRPMKLVPLTFAPDEEYTRGDLTISVARMCLTDEIGRPRGYFTDLLLSAPAGASDEVVRQVEREKMIAAISEELFVRKLYLFKDPAKDTLSHSGDLVLGREYLQWMELAKNSPECNQAKAGIWGFFQLLSFHPGLDLDGTARLPTRTHTPAPTNKPPKPGPTKTPAPPTQPPAPPTQPPAPPTNTPKPGGSDRRKHEPTKTPRPFIAYATATPVFCLEGNLQGNCGLSRIQAAHLLHQDLADWVFPPNQLPTPTPQVP